MAISHEVVNFALPRISNCREQRAGSATTTTGVRFCAASSAGLAKWVRAWKPGKKNTSARVMPDHMIHLRPILSESQAKKMYIGALATAMEISSWVPVSGASLRNRSRNTCSA